MELGQKLKAVRKAEGLTQKVSVKLAGWRSVQSKIMRGI